MLHGIYVKVNNPATNGKELRPTVNAVCAECFSTTMEEVRNKEHKTK
jgi:hypothetical protein